jgi:hypothetical protein
MSERVRVWQGRDREQQHFADPPPDDVVKRWEGTTICGVDGELTWIPPEHVDAGSHCPRCLTLVGSAPALEGDDPGPV